MINKVKKLLEYLIDEGGGAVVDILEAPYDHKPELTDEDDEEEEDDSKSEELFDKKVRDGKVITTKRDFKPDREPMVDVKNNANLMKARIKSRTPSANIKRKHSMLVRSRKID